MAKVAKTCRVCGKAYMACQTPSNTDVFRWQDVSCSPECGAEYLHRIKLSREVNSQPVLSMGNEDYYGFEGEPDEEYINEFGSDEEDN